MPYPMDFVVNISKTDSRLARAIWGDDCAVNFGNAIVRCDSNLTSGTIALDESDFRFVGYTSCRAVQNAVHEVQKNLQKLTPSILRQVLAGRLQALSTTRGPLAFAPLTSRHEATAVLPGRDSDQGHRHRLRRIRCSSRRRHPVASLCRWLCRV